LKFKEEPSSLRLIALTPLIDIVFILLVFFMLASSFLDWRAVDLRLTAGSGDPSNKGEVLVVRLLTDGSITLNGSALSKSDLEQQITTHIAEKPSISFIIRPEAGVPLQRAISLLDILKRVGVTNVSLSRDP